MVESSLEEVGKLSDPKVDDESDRSRGVSPRSEVDWYAMMLNGRHRDQKIWSSIVLRWIWCAWSQLCAVMEAVLVSPRGFQS